MTRRAVAIVVGAVSALVGLEGHFESHQIEEDECRSHAGTRVSGPPTWSPSERNMLAVGLVALMGGGLLLVLGLRRPQITYGRPPPPTEDGVAQDQAATTN